jgi:competence protein ComEA
VIDVLQLTTWLKVKGPLLLGGVGIMLLLSAAGIEYYKNHQNSTVDTFTAAEQRIISPKKIKVDIEGAVEKPGIYEIPDDSRIQDVLITAGGMTAKANRTMVSQSINLAQRVFDGQKIYIPFENETSNTVTQLPSNSKYININTASESELDTLSGIGPVTAKKIIAGRPYQNISDLITKHLVGASVYEKIKDSLTTY